MGKIAKKVEIIVRHILVDNLWNQLGKYYGYNHSTEPQGILTKTENEISKEVEKEIFKIIKDVIPKKMEEPFNNGYMDTNKVDSQVRVYNKAVERIKQNIAKLGYK